MMNYDDFTLEANKYSDILKHYKEDGDIFTDSNFPQSPILNYSDFGNIIEEKNIVWERIDKYYSAPLFQKRAIDGNVIKQGQLDDNILLSCFYKIAQQTELIERLFDVRTEKDDESIDSINLKCGAVIIYFYKFGRKIPILIDTQIPFNSETTNPIFSYPNDFHFSPWFCLVEKAYAKLNGDYSLIANITFSQTIYNLLGYFSYTHPIKYYFEKKKEQIQSQNDYIFSKLLNWQSKNFLIGTAITRNELNNDIKENEIFSCNLIPDKFYLITRVQRQEEKNFICLKSPSEDKIWNGDWSYSSNLWTQELKNNLEINSNNNRSTFWMIDRDFFRYFSIFYISKPLNSEFYRKEIIIKPNSDDFDENDIESQPKFMFKLKNPNSKNDTNKVYIQIERKRPSIQKTNFQLIIDFPNNQNDENKDELIESSFFTTKIKFKENDSFCFSIQNLNKTDFTDELCIQFICKHDFEIIKQEDEAINQSEYFQKYNDLNLNKNQFINLRNFEKLESHGKRRFDEEFRIKEIQSGKFFSAKIYNPLSDIKRIKQDIKSIAQFNHPSILKFIGISLTDFEQKKCPVLVTEYPLNGTLKQILEMKEKNPKIEWNDTKILINMYGIASAMSYIHSQNIIHRDLRPANIQEDENFYPKICNFCLSKITDNFDESKSSFVEVINDMVYRAPESLELNEYSASSDVYSFSMIVYEMFSSLKNIGINEIYSFINQGHRPKLPDSIPECYKQLIEQCYSQNPHDRPSFNDIVHVLKENENFITEKVNKNEFLNYVEFIDNYFKSLNSKTSSKNEKDELEFLKFGNLVDCDNASSEIMNQKANSIDESFPKSISDEDQMMNSIPYSETNLEREEESLKNTNLELNVKNVDLSNFIKMKKIGKGSFSTVFKVREKEANVIYAAKVSRKMINANSDPNLIFYIKNEVEILSRMNHPSIIKFIGYSPVDFNNKQNPVIVTGYASKGTLKKLLDSERKGNRLSEMNATTRLIIIYGIASAMMHLHSHNVIHRDLKPENVLLNDDLHPILADFGMAVEISHQNDKDEFYNDYKTVGTVMYLAPEILVDTNYSTKSDVYAFAITLYYIITKEEPYQCSALSLMHGVVNGVRPVIKGPVDKCYVDLISRCWRQNPDERPSFEEIVEELEKSPDFLNDSIDRETYCEYIQKVKSAIETKSRCIQLPEDKTDSYNFAEESSDDNVLSESENKNSKSSLSGEHNLFDLYELAASKDNPEALFYLGGFYLRGEFVPQDKQKAVQCFQRSADLDFFMSQFTLGCMYAKGDGVQMDLDKGRSLLSQAADRGHPGAMFELAQILYSSSKEEAIYLFKKSAENGNLDAQCRLASILVSGEEGVIERDQQKAVELYQKAADAGDVKAQLELGNIFLNGLSEISKDIEKAIRLFEKASDQGNSDAQFNLGYIYYKGQDVPIDMAKAARFFAMSADNGNALAQFNLGRMYSRGEIFAITDHKKSIELYKKSAEQNFAKAQYALGLTFSKGVDGVDRNLNEAIKYYGLAASQGMSKAQLNLGVIYFKGGEGVEQDKKKAAELFQLAADTNSTAMFNLALLYQMGDGVEKSVARAVDLYERAAEAGNRDAMHNLAFLYETGDCGVVRDEKKAESLYRRAAGLGKKQSQRNLDLMLRKKSGLASSGKERQPRLSGGSKQSSTESISKAEQSKHEDMQKPEASEEPKETHEDKQTRVDSSKHESKSSKEQQTYEDDFKHESEDSKELRRDRQKSDSHTKHEKLDSKEPKEVHKDDFKHESEDSKGLRRDRQKPESHTKHEKIDSKEPKEVHESEDSTEPHLNGQKPDSRAIQATQDAKTDHHESSGFCVLDSSFTQYLQEDEKLLEEARTHRANFDASSAVRCYEESARLGNSQALFEFGTLLMAGDLVSKDVGRAEQLFKEASKDVPESFVMLGDICKASGRIYEAKEHYFAAYNAGVSGAKEKFDLLFPVKRPGPSPPSPRNSHLRSHDQSSPRAKNSAKHQSGGDSPRAVPSDGGHGAFCEKDHCSLNGRTKVKKRSKNGDEGSSIRARKGGSSGEQSGVSRSRQSFQTSKPKCSIRVKKKDRDADAESDSNRQQSSPSGGSPRKSRRIFNINLTSPAKPRIYRSPFLHDDDRIEDGEDAVYHQFNSIFECSQKVESSSSSFLFTPHHSPPASNSSSSSSSSFIDDSLRARIANLEELAKSGSSKAALMLATCYGSGVGVAKNKAKALELYVKAADSGNADAQYEAGAYFAYGKGTTADQNKAFNYFCMAAENGNNRAMFAVGHFYDYGIGDVEKNRQKAVEWYRKAAENGNENAIRILKRSNAPLLEDMD